MIKHQIPRRVLRMKQLIEKVGYARSTIHQLVKEGRFPAPFKLTPDGRAVGWFEETIDNWQQEMLNASCSAKSEGNAMTELDQRLSSSASALAKEIVGWIEADIQENEIDPSEWVNDLYQYLKGICDG